MQITCYYTNSSNWIRDRFFSLVMNLIVDISFWRIYFEFDIELNYKIYCINYN